jgi:hypothetical protein
MMKRCKETTSHTGIWITKDASRDLNCHARSWLLWMRWRRRCIKCGTLLIKVATKLRVQTHMCVVCIGSKQLRWFKAFIALLKLCRWVALCFFGAWRRRSHVGIESFLDFLHIILELLAGFSFFMQSRLDGMVRATHAKQELEHFL